MCVWTFPSRLYCSSHVLSFNFSSGFLVAKSSERNDANLFLRSHLNSCFQYDFQALIQETHDTIMVRFMRPLFQILQLKDHNIQDWKPHSKACWGKSEGFQN